jgi:hypothetical protein
VLLSPEGSTEIFPPRLKIITKELDHGPTFRKNGLSLLEDDLP